ncbi:uncharacterized protein ACNS7B_008073 [Menidia menidia]
MENIQFQTEPRTTRTTEGSYQWGDAVHVDNEPDGMVIYPFVSGREELENKPSVQEGGLKPVNLTEEDRNLALSLKLQQETRRRLQLEHLCKTYQQKLLETQRAFRDERTRRLQYLRKSVQVIKILAEKATPPPDATKDRPQDSGVSKAQLMERLEDLQDKNIQLCKKVVELQKSNKIKKEEKRGKEEATQTEFYGKEGETQTEFYGEHAETQTEFYGKEGETQTEFYGEGETQTEFFGKEGETQTEFYGEHAETQTEFYGKEGETQNEIYGKEGETQTEFYGEEGETQTEFFVKEGETQTEFYVEEGETQTAFYGEEGETQTEGFNLDELGSQTEETPEETSTEDVCCTSGGVPEKPSLWRRFKKRLTPKSRRKYKKHL